MVPNDPLQNFLFKMDAVFRLNEKIVPKFWKFWEMRSRGPKIAHRSQTFVRGLQEYSRIGVLRYCMLKNFCSPINLKYLTIFCSLGAQGQSCTQRPEGRTEGSIGAWRLHSAACSPNAAQGYVVLAQRSWGLARGSHDLAQRFYDFSLLSIQI